MLSGKRFRLDRDTLSIEVVDGKRRAVTVPMGSVIKIASGPTNDDGLVKAVWESRTVEMFAIDVNMRGTEIKDRGVTA